jgi:hypothetical protein
VVFDTTSNITTDRTFTSQSNIVFDTESRIHLERLFKVQSDVVFDILAGIIRQERQFTVQSDIVFSTESLLSQIYNFTSVSLIEWEIPASPVNMFKTNLFQSHPLIVFEMLAQINTERLFASTVTSNNSDIGILWRTTNPDLKLTRLPVLRNFASTVNIIINVNSLNILNMSLDDLFPSTIKSLTPKQTTTLIGIN